MTRKNAKRHDSNTDLKKKLYVFASGVGVLLICVAIRYFWKMDQVDAQAPNGTTRPPANASTQPSTNMRPSNTMAIVNGQQITRDQLGHECLRRFGEPVLESLINKHIILAACEQRSIVVTKEDVEAEIESMAKKFSLDKQRWLEMLATERNIEPDQYRNEIVWPTIALRRLADGQITVTEDEVQQAFDSEFGPKVRIRMIAVTSGDKANQLRAAAAANPSSFGNLAKDHSEDKNSAAARGLLPPIRRNVGDPKLEQAAFALKESEISPVVQVANQYVILQCVQHIPESFVPPAQREKTRQAIREQLQTRKMRSAAASMFKKLQDQVKNSIVNVYNDPKLRKQYPGVAARIGSRQITTRDLAEQCISRHGEEVLDGEINRRLLMAELRKRNIVVSEKDVDAEIARAAKSYGFTNANDTPNIQGWLKMITEQEGLSVELYVHDVVWPTVALKKLVGTQVTVTPEDLQKGFESNYGQRVECLAIVLGDQRRAHDVWELARSNPTDHFFGQLAAQYSIEPVSRSNQGKVPPIRAHGGQPLVEQEAFTLKPGELSGIIASGDKFIILRCLGRTKPVVTEFNAVRNLLYEDIKEKKLRLAMAKTFDSVKESAQIDNFLTGTTQAGTGVRQASGQRPVPR